VAKFEDYADFSLIKCNENSFFNYAEFNSRINFDNARFGGNSDFLKVKFKTAEFKNTSFYSQLRMFESSVSDSINFENSFFLFGQPDVKFLGDKVKMTNLKTIK
jgi:hypothetical protein